MYILLPLYNADVYDYCYKTDELTIHPSPDAAMKEVYHDHNPDDEIRYEIDQTTGVWKPRYHQWDHRWQTTPNRWLLKFDDDENDGLIDDLWGYEIVKAANS